MASKTRALAWAVGGVLLLGVGIVVWQSQLGQRDRARTADGSRVRASAARPRSVVEAWRASRGVGSASIAGIVRDGDGHNVPGAPVALVVAAAYEDIQDKTALRPQATALAGPGGDFRFSDVPAGLYLLTATAPGWGPAELANVSLLAGEALEGLELRLRRGGVQLRGRISDAGGGPIAGATVRALALGAGGRPDGARTFLASTGADGMYRVVLSRGSYRLVADADGYSPQGTKLLLDSDRNQDFRLAPGARITVKVMDPAGAAVAGAHVQIESDAVILRPSRAAVSRTGKTDAGGSFSFVGVPPGTYRVSGRAAGLMGLAPKKVILSAGATAEVLLVLTRGPTIAGRVLDSGGRPVSGARVRVGELVSTLAAADGQYRLDGLIPGSHTLAADARGLSETRKQLTLGIADLKGIDLILEPETVVSGRVFGRNGEPVPGASITALVATPDALADQVTSAAVGRTDGMGKFTLGGLGPGDLRMEAEHPEEGRGVAGPISLSPGGRVGVEIHIGRGGLVRGTVRWEDQKPAVGAIVSGSQRRLPPLSAVTDEQGRYELGPFPVGETTVDARPETDALERGGSKTERRLDIASGRDVDGSDFLLTRRDEQISGTVRDPDGNPLVGATVGIARPHRGVSYRPYNKYAGEADGSDYSVLSDTQGAFTVRFLPKGTFDVWATHPEYVEGNVYGIATGSTGVVVRVGRGGVLAGVAADTSGKPVVAYNVSALLSQTNEASAQLREARGYVQATAPVHDSTGAFELGGLHPATYDLLITTADGRGGRLRRIPLGSGETKRNLRVIISETSTIRGRVVDEVSSAPIAGVTVMATLAMLVTDVRARTGSDGTFRLEGVVPGETILVTLRGDGRSHGVKRQPIPVPDGAKEVDAGILELPAAKSDRSTVRR